MVPKIAVCYHSQERQSREGSTPGPRNVPHLPILSEPNLQPPRHQEGCEDGKELLKKSGAHGVASAESQPAQE